MPVVDKLATRKTVPESPKASSNDSSSFESGQNPNLDRGEWKCQECGSVNPRVRKACNQCLKIKCGLTLITKMTSPTKSKNTEPRPSLTAHMGQWKCTFCGDVNPRTRKACQQCLKIRKSPAKLITKAPKEENKTESPSQARPRPSIRSNTKVDTEGDSTPTSRVSFRSNTTKEDGEPAVTPTSVISLRRNTTKPQVEAELTPKSRGSIGSKSSAVEKGTPQTRPSMRRTVPNTEIGEWTCAECGAFNSAFRKACIACYKINRTNKSLVNTTVTMTTAKLLKEHIENKGTQNAAQNDGQQRRGTVPVINIELGQWMCQECKIVNPRVRKACKECGKAKNKVT